MHDGTWRHTGVPFADETWWGRERQTTSITRTSAMRALGSVIYAARLADGTIKIGWTERFDRRLRMLCAAEKQDIELLAFRTGTYGDEQDIHRSLVAHRTGNRREFYRPEPEVLTVVNDMRQALGLDRIAACVRG